MSRFDTYGTLLTAVLRSAYVVTSDLVRYDACFYDSLSQTGDAPQDLLNAYAEIEASGYADLSHWSNILDDRAVAQEVQCQGTSESSQSSGDMRRSSLGNGNWKRRRTYITLSPPPEPPSPRKTQSELHFVPDIHLLDDEYLNDDQIHTRLKRKKVVEPERSKPPSPPEISGTGSQDEEPVEADLL